MKRKTIMIAIACSALLLGVNYFIAQKAKSGLFATIESTDSAESGPYRIIGASTRSKLSEFRGREYAITILPFDWVEHSLSATHTAFIDAKDQELRIRLRLNPFGSPYDIVGYNGIK